MTEHYRHASEVGYSYKTTKMESEFSPKKTMIILVIVVGCFAVLWPKVFYPMLVGSANQHIKPSAIDKTTGCCYVLSDSDVDTMKIMSDLCGNIIRERMGDAQLTGKQIINICQDEVFKTCGIDISAVLQEQVRIGHTTKQILDEIRSLNGSLCLKYNFGVPPWRLGVPHIITLRNTSETVRQERPTHVRSELVHPAFRERGRAIPEVGSQSRSPPRIVEGRPGPIPGMRPTMGGAGHVVPPSKQGTGSMGVIMPVYTVGIVIFFTYTLMKIIFKKHPDTDTIYSSMDQDGPYRKGLLGDGNARNSRDAGSCKLVVNAMSALLDEVDLELQARRQSSEVVMQDDQTPNATMSNGSVKKEEKPSVKIMGMEASESCEGGQKWQSSNSAILPNVPQMVNDHVAPPQEIYLNRALPPQSQILVADSATKTEENTGDDPAVVLAGKMTLSVISLENEDIEIGEIQNVNIDDIIKNEIETKKPIIREEIDNIIEEAIENLQNNTSDEVSNIVSQKKNFNNEDEMSKLVECSIQNYKLNEIETGQPTIDIIDDETIRTNGNELTQKNYPENSSKVKFDESDNKIELKENNNSEITQRPFLESYAKSSSEESANTILTVSDHGSVIQRNNDNITEKDTQDQDMSGESEESDEEYGEESEEEEIEISGEEEEEEIDKGEVVLDNNDTLGTDTREEVLNVNGNSVLSNGVSDAANDGCEDNDSEEDEIIEIIEEYSEEEEEEAEETNDAHQLSSNGNIEN